MSLKNALVRKTQEPWLMKVNIKGCVRLTFFRRELAGTEKYFSGL